MGKLNFIFEEIISELAASEIRAKYYSDINEKDFMKIVSSDPKTIVKGGELKKIGKYSKILLNLYKIGNLKFEDLPKATEYLTIIYKKQIPVKINLIKGLPDLFDLVKGHIVQDGETDVAKLVDSIDENDYDLLFNGEKWYIFQPKNEVGACTLGSGTEWCTAWGKHSTNPKYKGRSSHYQAHSKGLYILIDKSDNSIKYQFHPSSNQYMDKNDRSINMSNFLDSNLEVLHYFNPELKGDLKDIKNLENIIDRELISESAKNLVVGEIVRRNSNHPMIKLFLEAENTGEYKALNKRLTPDFEIDYIDRDDVNLMKFDDSDLNIYKNLNYYSGDDYLEDEDIDEYYDPSINEMFNQKKELLAVAFLNEGLDIEEFLDYISGTKYDYNDGRYDNNFLDNLINLSDNRDKVNEQIRDVVLSSKRSASSDAVTQMINKVDKKFDVHYKTISRVIFMLFLINYDYYDMDNFKEFLNSTFDIPTEGYEIYNDISQLEHELLNVDINEIVEVYDSIEYEIVEHFIDEHKDIIIKFNHSSYGDNSSKWGESVSDDDYEEAISDIYNKLHKVVHDSTGTFSMFMSNTHRTLRIVDNKINIPDESVYIEFTDNVNKKEFKGYVKIKHLTNYINFKTNYQGFWSKFNKIMDGLNLDSRNDTFENDLVILKLDYNKIDFENEEIFIELTSKKSNKTIDGMVNIESLPTHFQNYKLFESLRLLRSIL